MRDEAIGDRLDDLIARLRPEGKAVASICLGIAGAGSSERRSVVEHWARTRLPGTRARVVRDVDLVLASGSPDRTGIAVVAGTGSIVIGRTADGIERRAGGRGPLVGDDSSGFQLGLSAIRLVMRSLDGAHDHPATVARVMCSCLGIDRPELAGLAAIREGVVAIAEIAALGGQIVLLAQNGDRQAEQLVRAAAHSLAQLYRLVARQLSEASTVPHLLAGGLVLAPVYREAFIQSAAAPRRWQIVTEPVLGGLRLAAMPEA
jgi:glucosamine kinase